MSTLDNFLKEWNSSRPLSLNLNKRARIFDDVLEVELSKSARPNTIRINSIKSTKNNSKKLSVFMSWLEKKADKDGFNLTLAAQPFGWNKDDLPSKDKIKEIMERFGFKVVYEYPDKEGYEMIRELTSNLKK